MSVHYKGDRGTVGTKGMAVWPDLSSIFIDWGATCWMFLYRKITTAIGGVLWLHFIILCPKVGLYFELTKVIFAHLVYILFIPN